MIRLRLGVTAVAAAALALSVPPTLAASPTPSPGPAPGPSPGPALKPSPATARLQGTFLLAGRVTVADDVRGEHRGEAVLRRWTFSSPCAAGPCATVQLVRRRARGTDTVRLRRLSAGYYRGSGRFYAPLRCAKRTYSKGESVPFTIAVRVTAATVANATVLATGVRASYTNRTRTNLTPCFAVLGHDAATYRGHLMGSS